MMRKKEQTRQRALTHGGGGRGRQQRQGRDQHAHNNAAFDAGNGDGDVGYNSNDAGDEPATSSLLQQPPHATRNVYSNGGVGDNLRNPEYDPPMSPPQPAGAEYATVDETHYDVADAYPDDIEPANYDGLDGHTTYASSA